ncbi:MAG: pyridoxamine 5'-phosphate oxidase family protein [Thermoleophilaceae bacterium]
MGSGALSDLPDWARDLLERGRVARLGFADDEDRPRVLPVTYAAAGDSIWSAIDDKPKRSREPARLRYLRRRPQAALTVDRYDDDWDDLAWVQLLCDVEIVVASDAPDAVAALRDKYTPYLASAPPGPLIRLQPRRALWWSARPS